MVWSRRAGGSPSFGLTASVAGTNTIVVDPDDDYTGSASSR